MTHRIQKTKGITAVIIASLLWGTTGTAASFTPNVSPLATGAFAMGVAGLLLVISAWRQLRMALPSILAKPKRLIIGGASVMIYPLAFYSSMRLSGVAIGTVISIASAPFFVALLEYCVNKKVISTQWWLSFLVGTLGVLCLTLGKHQDEINNTAIDLPLGIIFGLIAGLSYALYSWATKQFIDDGVDSQSSIAALFGFAAIFLLISLTVTGEHLLSTPLNVSVAIYMAVVPIFLGYVLFSYGLKFIEASHATLITLIEPLAATALAVLIVGETFNPMGWLGLVLVMVCLIMQTIKFKRVTTRTT